MLDQQIAVVGNGPAGTRAAETLVRAGCQRVTVISEAPASGGQIYRRQPAEFHREASSIYGDDVQKAKRLHSTFDALIGRIDYRPNTLVWNVFDSALHLTGSDGAEVLPFDRLIITTGAMDRVLPIPGWTLPGVFTLGGAQIALKHQACSIGSSVVFAGTGPLLYLVAYQYVKAGAQVAAVLDTASFANKVRGVAGMLNEPGQLVRGLRFMRYLRAKGVPLHEGVQLKRISGVDSVTGISAGIGTRSVDIACDAIGLGFGLNPELQLAEIAGCRTEYQQHTRQWVVAHDGYGRAAGHIYIAGDGAVIGGADVAELTGELAALSLLADIGVEHPVRDVSRLRREIERLMRFRGGVDTAFPFPFEWISRQPDETILCRCENITFGEVRETVARFGAEEVNRLKALSRPGMGRCQGRVCGPVLAELLAAATGQPLEKVGKLRAQAPVKPVQYAATAKLSNPAIEDWLTTPTGTAFDDPATKD